MRALRPTSDSRASPQVVETQHLPDPASFYRVNAPADKLDQLAAELIAGNDSEMSIS